jgi:hypothetical protein
MMATTVTDNAKTISAERRRDKADRSNRANIGFPLYDMPGGSLYLGNALAYSSANLFQDTDIATARKQTVSRLVNRWTACAAL